MKNAKKFNDYISLGLVPGEAELEKLNTLDYKTLIDLRALDEKFDDFIERKSIFFGFNYINIPVKRNAITIDDVKNFYCEVYIKGTAPVYIFSRLGKKPLVLLLLFDAIARDEPVIKICRRTSRIGLKFEEEIRVQKFLYDLKNSGDIKEFNIFMKCSTPDLFEEQMDINYLQTEESPQDIRINPTAEKFL